MKILFVSSGKSGFVGKVVKNQGESLSRAGLEITYFTIKPGLSGYISAISQIRKIFITGNYDLIHAHYSLSGLTASLSGPFKIIVSLMGSDVYMSGLLRAITRSFSKRFWTLTIVKSDKMREILHLDKALVFPNGVDIERFKPIPKAEAKRMIRYTKDRKIILFVGNPNRPEKNFFLARKAVELNNDNNTELVPVHNLPNEEIAYYLNAAEILLLTSKWEGSANAVKEAMACNCPVVSTDVGDVGWITRNTKGCFITDFEPENVAKNIRTALELNSRTNGRERIISLELDSKLVAKRLIEIYNKVCQT